MEQLISWQIVAGYMFGAFIFTPRTPWPISMKFLLVAIGLLLGYVTQQLK